MRVSNEKINNQVLFSYQKVLSDESLKAFRQDMLNVVKTLFNQGRSLNKDNVLLQYIKIPF